MNSSKQIGQFLTWLEEQDKLLDSGISTKQLRVLVELERNDNIEVGTLASRTGYAQSTTSRLVSQLGHYRKGPALRGNQFIEWHVDPLDRRVQRIKLTAKGRDFLATFAAEITRLGAAA